MKKYTSRGAKWLGLLAGISVAALSAGICCIVINTANVDLQVAFTLMGAMLSIVFLPCYFAERSRYLVMDAERIILPRGAVKNGKLCFRRTVINTDEICAMKSVLRKGDRFVTKDTFFHTVILKDGTSIQFTLYAYGKDEEEILEGIKKHIL